MALSPTKPGFQQKPSPKSPFSSGILAPIIRENSIFLGGSSMGKGFRRAARYYLRKEAPLKIFNAQDNVSPPTMMDNSHLLNPGVEHRVEEPFYVVDVGMVVSQFYQWKQYFPRVEPFYAVKCNPDKVIVKTLAILGCNFDCASRNEMRLVQEITKNLPRRKTATSNNNSIKYQPEIVYANPCKSRSHIIEAVCRGVTMMTFDNVAEVKKCASVSKNIQLILRIITDDSGSQCRLSSKFGAPKSRWRDLLGAAKEHDMQVIGVSFHVGSGCRDASRYELALKDARELFDIARDEFGYEMTLLDIGGGFPGETHSMWNPADVFGDPTAVKPTTEVSKRKYTIDEEIDDESVADEKEGVTGDAAAAAEAKRDTNGGSNSGDNRDVMYFREIAESVVPIMDELFPPESGVRIIAEPGRYLVAASMTLCTSIIGVRSNATAKNVEPLKISDAGAAFCVDQVTRADEDNIVAEASKSEQNPMIGTIVEEIGNYSELFTRLNLCQQEFDVYTENADLTAGHVKAATPLLAPPQERLLDGEKMEKHHTVEGMQTGIVASCLDDNLSVMSEMDTTENSGNIKNALSLMAAGEAAVSGVVFQAIADTAPCQDDYAYYVNDGCYGGFNNLIFDHAIVRPRRLKNALSKSHKIMTTETNGFMTLEAVEDNDDLDSIQENGDGDDDALYPSTVFGPTCDSIDVISRSVLLPKMSSGDWLYFQNMGAYTSAAASDFNGFTPTEKFYVCSVQPEHFEQFNENGAAAGSPTPASQDSGEEKKYGEVSS